MYSAEEIIQKLGLKPHPKEGGYYAETYRSDEVFSKIALPKRYPTNKSFATAIFYLLTPDTFSALHKLSTDEIFHFYLGDPVTMLHLYSDGSSQTFELGQDILNGQLIQLVVPKETWQGAVLKGGGKFTLLGTTMAPGFDFSDYKNASRKELIKKYPMHQDLITRLTIDN